MSIRFILWLTIIMAVAYGNDLFADSTLATNYTAAAKEILQSRKSQLTLTASDTAPLADGIQLTPGRHYWLQYQVQGEGFSGNATGYHPFRVIVGADGVEVASETDDTWNSSFLSKTFEFQAPGANCSLRIEVQSEGGVTFRDFVLSELAPQLQTATCRWTLTAPIWRDNFYTSEEGASAIQGTLQLPAGSSGITLTAPDGTVSELPESEKPIAFSFPIPDTVPAEYRLSVRWSTPDGQALESERIIRRLPAAPHEVRIGANKRLYVDGEAFFPVMWWENYAQNMEKHYYHMSKIGLNVALSDVWDSSQRALELLDQAERQGMKLILFTGNHRLTDESAAAEQAWQRKLASIYTEEVRRHPALLGYFFVDEPMWAGIPVPLLEKSYAFYRELDPYHPVWINAAPRGTVEQQRPYAACTDIYGVDIYPVPMPTGHSGLDNKSYSCVGDYAQRMNDITGGGKPIWMALQGFAWSDLDPAAEKQYPTLSEMRYMLYDSLVFGADGITWWGNYAIKELAFYNILTAIAGEVRDLSGILATGNRLPLIHAGDAVVILPIEYAGTLWFLAVNRSAQAASCRIELPQPISALHELRENRAIALSNGGFHESFPAWGTHLYGTGDMLPPIHTAPLPVPQWDAEGAPWLQPAEK